MMIIVNNLLVKLYIRYYLLQKSNRSLKISFLDKIEFRFYFGTNTKMGEFESHVYDFCNR